MIKYWKGKMDWPIKADWKCEICGEYAGLTWGIPHAVCRCNKCHTHYKMKDENGKVVNTPICLIKGEYYDLIKRYYAKYKKPIDRITERELRLMEKEKI